MKKREIKNIHKFVMTSMMAGLCCIATLIIHIPSPTGGYANLGDVIVLISAYLLGPWWGGAAAGIGSALADLIGGYPVYIPASLLIKALMGIAASVVYSLFKKKSVAVLVSGIAAEFIMVAGYWFYDGLLMGSFVASLSGVAGNIVQAGVAIIISSLLTAVLQKNIKID